MSLVDRQIIAILLEPIKDEFQASDTAMGLLTGLVFSAFYVVAAVPLGRWADFGVRRSIIAITLGFWSFMTSLGGLAQSYLQLAITRIGVAIGEAAASPAQQSLIADLYPVSQRGRALATLSAFGSTGIFFSLFLGGWLSDTFGWRLAFILVGLPGLIVAAAIRLTVAEPPRGMADAVTDSGQTPALGEALAELWRMKSYRFIVLTIAIGGLVGFGMLSWTPAFFMRVHGFSATQAGLWFGISVALGLIGGNLCVGVLSDHFGRDDIRGYMRVGGCGVMASAPFGVLAAWWPTPTGAVICFALFQFLLSFHLPPAQAMVQTLVRSRMRGTAVVGFLLCQNLIGAGLGPLLIGMLNDALAPELGNDAVRYSLSVIMALAALAGVAALSTNRWIRSDYQRTWSSA